MSTKPKTGWLPDPYDVNDYTLRTNKINAVIKQIQFLRNCSDLLEKFEDFIKQPQESGSKNASQILSKFFLGTQLEISRQSLQERSGQLRADLKVILTDLVSGIDLISAKLSSEVADYQPLTPPISPNVLKILQENQLIASVEKEVTVTNFEDERLQKIRKILHQVAPLAQYQKGAELAAVLQEAAKETSQNIDLSAKAIKGENIICIDPKNMYDLSLTNNDSEANSSYVRLPLDESLSSQIKGSKAKNYVLPDVVDLSYWCSNVKNQGNINACTSHAIASLVEYFRNRIAEQFNPDFTPALVSPRFLYKVTRRLGEQNQEKREEIESLLKNSGLSDEEIEDIFQELNSLTAGISVGFIKTKEKVKAKVSQDITEKLEEAIGQMVDVGASLRQTFKALQLFGVPAERYWPYNSKFPDFDEEPPQFCYAFAQNYQATKYFRLDFLNAQRQAIQGNGLAGEASGNTGTKDKRNLILTQIKAVLAAGFPAVCGFLSDSDVDMESGVIPVPQNTERLQQQLTEGRDSSHKIFGHAVLVVGYSDQKVTDNQSGQRGAFLIQNSYGEAWGVKGYGWLPYEFVLNGLATDWWSLLNAEWIEIGSFGLDTSLGKPKKTPV